MIFTDKMSLSLLANYQSSDDEEEEEVGEVDSSQHHAVNPSSPAERQSTDIGPTFQHLPDYPPGTETPDSDQLAAADRPGLAEEATEPGSLDIRDFEADSRRDNESPGGWDSGQNGGGDIVDSDQWGPAQYLGPDQEAASPGLPMEAERSNRATTVPGPFFPGIGE